MVIVSNSCARTGRHMESGSNSTLTFSAGVEQKGGEGQNNHTVVDADVCLHDKS